MSSDCLTASLVVHAGVIGGALACWNHPFEVARVEAQANAAAGGTNKNMFSMLANIVKTQVILWPCPYR